MLPARVENIGLLIQYLDGLGLSVKEWKVEMDEHIHIYPQICPVCRYLPSTEVKKIRDALQRERAVGKEEIIFKAFNHEEVLSIKRLLTEDEIKKIHFKWWIWEGLR